MEQKIDPKILAKIKKCLALAGSDNPNEAATALRQAHALMEKHGLGVHDVAMSDIGQAESPSQTMSRDAPADWEARLANQVAKAFGCKTLIKKIQMPTKGTPLNDGAFVFIGLKHQAEIAAYTASILIRKCRTGRQRWIARLSEQAKEQGGRIPKAKLTAIGDAFATGWVHKIAETVRSFAQSDAVSAAIDAYVDGATTSDQEAKVRNVFKSNIGEAEKLSAYAGMQSAADERLYRPVNGAAPQQALSA